MSGSAGLLMAATGCSGPSSGPLAAEESSPPAPGVPTESKNRATSFSSDDNSWNAVRDQFILDRNSIHMSAMLLASHPGPVREAIARHRDGLDRNPVTYLRQHMDAGLTAARKAAASYLGTGLERIALTNSTTNGVGLTYNGLKLAPGDEVLTTSQNYYVTFETLRQLSLRYDARVRTVDLYNQPSMPGEEEAVFRILEGITEATRLVALTWVHSSTGYKLPARAISQAIADLNADRPADRQILIGLDGVHGFAVENFNLDDLGCDFFMTGCHKWLFGPRGTGLIAAGPRGFDFLIPSVPSFIEHGGAFDGWYLNKDDPGPNNAQRMTPGGFQAFDHKLALTEAFSWHSSLGKAEVASRTHRLAQHLKEGLATITGVTVQTPHDTTRSAGIVAFDIQGQSANDIVGKLGELGIIASVAPYSIPHARLTPSILNSHAEIESVLQAIRTLV